MMYHMTLQQRKATRWTIKKILDLEQFLDLILKEVSNTKEVRRYALTLS